MDYTQNLHLPQWEESDRIMHDDFNNAFAALDAGVKAANDAAAAAPRIATGSYTGIGRGNMQLNFSFTPKFIAITGRNGYTGAAVVAEGSGEWNTYIIGGNSTAVGGRPTYTLSGGSFYLQHENNVAAYALNENNVVYYYLAIG